MLQRGVLPTSMLPVTCFPTNLQHFSQGACIDRQTFAQVNGSVLSWTETTWLYNINTDYFLQKEVHSLEYKVAYVY